MTLRAVVVSAAVAVVGSNLRADVTIFYKSDFQSLQSMPPGISEPAFKQAFSPQSIRIRGTKCLSTAENITMLTDLSRQEVTIMDAAKKMFATLSIAEYAEKMTASMSQLSPAAQNSVKMTAKTSVRHTGRTTIIQGIQAEEHEITLSIETEIRDAVSQSGPLLRYVLQAWTVRPEAMSSIPALRELAAFNAVQNYFADPAEMLRKTAIRITGSKEGMAPILDEFGNGNSTTLRSVADVYMPALGAISEKLAIQKGQAITGGFDPNAPFMRIIHEVTGFSTAPLEESSFQIPVEYAPVSADELMKTFPAR